MLIPRILQQKIDGVLFKNKVILLFGARQVGKTTLLREIQKKRPDNSVYLNCDEPDVRASFTNTTSTALGALIKGKKLVLLDEAQRVNNIGLTLKLMADNFPETQVIATGSSAFELSNKTIVVDTPLWLYQFLSSIRQRDGTLLTDSKGNITSHLAGLLSRVTNLMEKQIKLAFVFDGEPPELKRKTLEKRKEIKQEAQKEYEKAAEKGDEELMKKYAQRTSRMTDEMIEEAERLIEALGLPVIQAPTEAEAQASHIVRKGDAFALATNDADALLFGATRIVRNLNMVGKKKKSNKLAYETIQPDLIVLEENLKHLGITREQLIALAMLVGTDFNLNGIKGIGPKNALKLVKKHDSNFELLFKEVKWNEFFDYPWEDFRNIRKDYMKRKILAAYKNRSFFHPPYKKKHFVMSSEELATIFHLPGKAVETSSLNRVVSRKAEAPANLPI